MISSEWEGRGITTSKTTVKGVTSTDSTPADFYSSAILSSYRFLFFFVVLLSKSCFEFFFPDKILGPICQDFQMKLQAPQFQTISLLLLVQWVILSDIPFFQLKTFGPIF